MLYTCMSSGQPLSSINIQASKQAAHSDCQCRLLAKPACRPGQAAYRTNVVVAAGKSIAEKEKSLQTEILFKPFEEVRRCAPSLGSLQIENDAPASGHPACWALMRA